MTDRIYALISKYALLLSIFYFLSYAFSWTVNTYELPSDERSYIYLRAISPVILDLLLNISAALVVKQDVDKYKVGAKYVILATLLYRPLGVVAFLLFLILQNTGVTQRWNSIESDPDIIDQ